MLSYHADFVMADPAQLRKCEELLGKLPEKPPARVRNPVWVFLKGIEGFDTKRASECLVKLLDKHYDTIGVLKLATKRDLVEDAGVLPGDALRIVAAAKHYVAPQNSDHSAGFGVSEPAPQNDASKPGGVVVPSKAHHVQSVEHHQHAYRTPALREKTVILTPSVTSQANTHAFFPQVMQEKKVTTVAQKSWKSEEQVDVNRAAPVWQEVGTHLKEVKVVNQVAVPKVEAVKESKVVKQTAPNHINDILDVKDSKVPEQTFPIPDGITYPHTCRICNVQCVSEINGRMHYNGRTHKAKFAEVLEVVKKTHQPPQALKAVKETKKPAETQQVVLEAKQPTQAPKAAKESKKLAQTQEVVLEEQPTPSIPVVPLHACGVCNVHCTSEVDIRSHFNGRKHTQNMEIAADSNDNRPTAFLHCSVCNINSTCKRNLVMHFNGKKHAQNMKKVDSDSGDSSYYSNSESDC
ncbi:hypothetical protein KC19_1G273300 [Ceratodon purpureus]|uniref:C2H2-type domain-containing protein n=1 Tax=Ceratodon purpureus TaxID=3225 RepID=A0A8T0JDB1_CERPU|nr:hypothetical protein KC19_1G273300 [Ceratodon purpureus]